MKNFRFPLASSKSNSTPSGTNGNILPFDEERSYFFVQNLSTGILYLNLDSGAASNNFNIILRACTNSGDGTGGVYVDDRWLGMVSVSGSLNTSYIAWQAK